MNQDQVGKVAMGIIYSKLIEQQFKPQIWFPDSISLDIIQKIVEQSTVYFSIRDAENWNNKFSILPVPICKFLGLTYFYKDLQ